MTPYASYRPETLEELSGFVFEAPARFTFTHPLRGGPALRDLRARFTPHGKVRFSCTHASVFVDIVPGPPETPIVTLDMIVRSDAAGLERAIHSAMVHVDYIIVGIDERSDAATHTAAAAFADEVHVFDAQAIGLSAEDWAADKMHFSNARNIGRAKVQTPWALILDTDEYFSKVPVDLRIALQPQYTAIEINVNLGTVVMRDTLRLARTRYRWFRATHNQLNFSYAADEVVAITDDICVMHDTSLRTRLERARRDAQRAEGHAALVADSDQGDLNATFHVAKHFIGEGDLAAALKATEKFRSFAEVRGPATGERAVLACGLAELYYRDDNFDQAELWAFRALLDGPILEAFYRLGDIAEDRGDLPAALFWFDCACRAPMIDSFGWLEGGELRWARRTQIREAIGALEGIAPELVTATASMAHRNVR